MKIMKLPEGITSHAEFSECMNYRYILRRTWNRDLPVCAFIMLNPSTADAAQDDPTVAKCRRYAMRWGFGDLIVLNLFAWRSTDPSILPGLDDPVGPNNNYWILNTIRYHFGNGSWMKQPSIICAWGKHGNLRNRASFISESLRQHFDLHALKINGDGTPAHPLYLKGRFKPDSLQRET